MRMRRIHVLGVFSSLLFIFLLNQLIFGPQRSLLEDNNVDAHGDWEKRLSEVKNGSRLDDSGALSLSHARIVTAGDLPTIKPLDCVRSKPVLGVSPLVCIKPVQEDLFISAHILFNGIWEEDIVTNVLKVAKLYKVIEIPIFLKPLYGCFFSGCCVFGPGVKSRSLLFTCGSTSPLCR